MTDYNNDPALVRSHAELLEALKKAKPYAQELIAGRAIASQIKHALRNAESLAGKKSSEKLIKRIVILRSNC